MSLPSGMPRISRTTTSQIMLGTKACASANTTNITIVVRKIARRPIRSDSQPPSSEPTMAPPWVPAPARPSSAGDGWNCSRRKISTKAIEYRSQASTRMDAIISQPTRVPFGL